MFPCILDDYIVFNKDGTTNSFSGAVKCYPGEPDKSLPIDGMPSRWDYDNKTHILYFRHIPLDPVNHIIGDLKSEVLELTKNKLVITYVQEHIPFTNTTHTIVETYQAIP